MIAWPHKSQQPGDQGGVDFTLSPAWIVGTNSVFMQFKQDSDKQGFIHTCTHSNKTITSSYLVRLGSSKKELTLLQKFFSFLSFFFCFFSSVWILSIQPCSHLGAILSKSNICAWHLIRQEWCSGKSNVNINISPDLIQVCGSAVKRAITCAFLLHSDSNRGPRLTANSSRPKHNPAFTDVIFENEI